jgi:uncharacterized membrane protein YhaH (DUF805 family)
MTNSIIFPRRIGRVSFAIRYALFLGAVWLGALLLATGVDGELGKMDVALRLLAVAMLVFCLFYVIRHILIARLRDVGLHSLWAVLIFIPIVNLIFALVLLFAPENAFAKSIAAP